MNDSLKMEWLIANVQAVGLPIKSESEVVWAIFGIFWPGLVVFGVWSGRLIMSCKTHFEPETPYL